MYMYMYSLYSDRYAYVYMYMYMYMYMLTGRREERAHPGGGVVGHALPQGGHERPEEGLHRGRSCFRTICPGNRYSFCRSDPDKTDEQACRHTF